MRMADCMTTLMSQSLAPGICKGHQGTNIHVEEPLHLAWDQTKLQCARPHWLMQGSLAAKDWGQRCAGWAQVIYPLAVADAATAEEGATEAVRLQALDQRLDGLMGAVRLAYLVKREGGWDAAAHWGDTLSLGAHHAQS